MLVSLGLVLTKIPASGQLQGGQFILMGIEHQRQGGAHASKTTVKSAKWS